MSSVELATEKDANRVTAFLGQVSEELDESNLIVNLELRAGSHCELSVCFQTKFGDFRKVQGPTGRRG